MWPRTSKSSLTPHPGYGFGVVVGDNDVVVGDKVVFVDVVVGDNVITADVFVVAADIVVVADVGGNVFVLVVGDNDVFVVGGNVDDVIPFSFTLLQQSLIGINNTISINT